MLHLLIIRGQSALVRATVRQAARVRHGLLMRRQSTFKGLLLVLDGRPREGAIEGLRAIVVADGAGGHGVKVLFASDG